MSEQNGVRLIEDWQTGFFVILVSVLSGYLVSIGLSHLLYVDFLIAAVGFVIGAIGMFVTLSYVFFK